jgi:Transposase DDE domain group 1
MTTRIITLPQRGETQYVPLAVLGYCLTRTDFLGPLARVELKIKTVEHAPVQKLQDVLVSILANCSSVKQVDLRIRPDFVLAQAWGREQFAQQSTLADTLDAFNPHSVEQLREATQTLYRQYGRVGRHEFGNRLFLDIDLTGLPCSPQAQESEKGYFSQEKNTYGRQLVRASAPSYHETLFSRLYPGGQSGQAVFKPTVRALQAEFEWSREQRSQIIWRTDSGLGTDANLNWALSHDYQVLMKGYNGKRASALARRIAARDWYQIADEKWIALPSQAPRYARRTQTLVLRWRTPKTKKMKYATLVHSLLEQDWHRISALYDDRGAMEGEIKADKFGLLLPRRRKRLFAAQEALILLTDLAHNLATWTQDWMFAGSRFASYGPVALVNDVFCVPGELILKGDKLQMVALRESHPYAADLALCLAKLLTHFGNP